MKVRGKRFIIVASQFNTAITQALVRGARDILQRAGASSRDVRLVWVPGAFELPVVAARLASSRPRPHAIIAVGAILRGETPQYEVLAHAVAQGLTQVAISAVIPVTFGVVVAQTLAQARARAAGLSAAPKARAKGAAQAGQAGGTVGNRGAEAAMAALAVLHLFETMDGARLSR